MDGHGGIPFPVACASSSYLRKPVAWDNSPEQGGTVGREGDRETRGQGDGGQVGGVRDIWRAARADWRGLRGSGRWHASRPAHVIEVFRLDDLAILHGVEAGLV